jgi:LysR family glycine cleavage system transcriptional activator
MRRQIPPLEAVEAFLAATQARSFRAAAEALALSPSAFSRRIQLLERFVGTDMFDRRQVGTPLTPSGERYLSEIGPALEMLRQATMALCDAHGERRVRIATSHSFAAEWLIPRLPALAKVHDIEVVLTVSRDSALLRTGVVELAIRGERLPEAGGGEVVAPLDVVAVAAPQLNGRPPPRSIPEIVGERLLGVAGQDQIWHDFLRRSGFTGDLPAIGGYETNQLAYEAAVSGLGVTLATPLLSDRFLADGRLVGCLQTRQKTGFGYVLRAAAPRVRNRPAVRDFIAWLKPEVDRSMAQFDRWHSGTR